MAKVSSTAMILAAGRGERMRPLTLEKPKPLFEVGGHTMLDQAIDRLKATGITRIIINTHYLAEQIEQHVAKRRDIEIVLSHELTLLNTGGGVKNALHHFSDLPFFVLNADLPWIDGSTPALQRMKDAWDANAMDVLLLLMPREKAHGFGPKGDYVCEANGRTHRLDTLPPYPHVMLSAQIIKPELYNKVSEPIFSNAALWDDAEKRGKLYGIIHDGQCFHVGTPEDWVEANRRLQSGEGW